METSLSLCGWKPRISTIGSKVNVLWLKWRALPDDNGADIAEDGNSTDYSERSIVLFEMVNCFIMYVIKMKKEKQ